MPKALRGWMSPKPSDLLGKNIDAGNRALEQMPFDLLRDKDGLNLRDYQLRAIQAAEQTIMDGKIQLCWPWPPVPARPGRCWA